MEILRWKRNNVGRGPHADDIDWPSWENAVALAGGHPGLLLQCFNILTDNNRGVELNPSTEAAVCVGLMSTERMKKSIEAEIKSKQYLFEEPVSRKCGIGRSEGHQTGWDELALERNRRMQENEGE